MIKLEKARPHPPTRERYGGTGPFSLPTGKIQLDEDVLPHPSPLNCCWVFVISSEDGKYESVMSISPSPMVIFSTIDSAILRLSSRGSLGHRSYKVWASASTSSADRLLTLRKSTSAWSLGSSAVS